jgi:L-rhamnose mutarotase
MERMAFRMQIKPSTEEEYKRRHDQIWPELLDALARAGFRNYSIYRDGLTLFAYFESPNVQHTLRRIANDPIYQRWAEMMSDILVVELDPDTGLPSALPEMFHFD